MNKKPPMCQEGLVFFITIAYPPNPAASSVVHRHLLDQFDPNSFVVVTAKFFGAKKSEIPLSIIRKVVYLNFEFVSTKIHNFFAGIQKRIIPFYLKWLVKKHQPVRIVAVYPDLYFLKIAFQVATDLSIPFVPYLHDTIVEGTYNIQAKKAAEKTQEEIFKSSFRIAVISEGMRRLYHTKYGIETTSWEHIYPEQILRTINQPTLKENRAHWSGDVYEINHKAVYRLNQAINNLPLDFTISNGKTREQLKRFKIGGKNVSKTFFPLRKDYLQHLSQSKILLLALNYPDECNVDIDELSTIFPTKTPEYLASGSLIIYHGPEDYFLAEFLKSNNCAVIVPDRDIQKIKEILKEVLTSLHQYQYLMENAQRSLKVFDPNSVRNKVTKLL